METIANDVLRKTRFPLLFLLGKRNLVRYVASLTEKILVEQFYPNEKDLTDHFNYLLPFFEDERYIKAENKPLFII